MWDWLRHHDRVRLCLATKADKIGRTQWPAHLKQIVHDLGISAIRPPEPVADPSAEPVLLFSAETGAGREELWRWVTGLVKANNE